VTRRLQSIYSSKQRIRNETRLIACSIGKLRTELSGPSFEFTDFYIAFLKLCLSKVLKFSWDHIVQDVSLIN
jgi:hypothetical protein